MIKGTRVEGTNSTEVGTGGTCPSLITVPTNKTFVLTDMVLSPAYAGVETSIALVASADMVAVYDLVMSGGTAGSGTSNALFKIGWQLDMASSGATGIAMRRVGAVYHFSNGPEFSRALSVEVSGVNSVNVPTGGIWVSGLLR